MPNQKQPNRPRNGNSKSNSHNPIDWKNFEFANVKLTKPQQDEFHRWYEDNNKDIDEYVRQLVNSNHKITLSSDQSNDCVIASVTCKDELSPNYGYVLTSRSDNWLEALCLCVFKDTVVCVDIPWSEAGDTSNWG